VRTMKTGFRHRQQIGFAYLLGVWGAVILLAAFQIWASTVDRKPSPWHEKKASIFPLSFSVTRPAPILNSSLSQGESNHSPDELSLEIQANHA